MKRLPPLPKSELEVARIVWDRGEATVREVADSLPDDRPLDFFTVQTYLRRLTEKGYLKVRRRGRANVYSARVAPTRVIRQVVEEFLQGVFGGETIPLLQHLIRERPISEDEIRQLQTELDKLTGRKS
ncbi:MAG: BlaI/MecI/CopY family transcriptional regulator [Pirellulales bacterium]|nr:BlaI/MecI/CopY family transcriptional regulator [Pirellulales bacterium]